MSGKVNWFLQFRRKFADFQLKKLLVEHKIYFFIPNCLEIYLPRMRQAQRVKIHLFPLHETFFIS